MRRLQGDSRQVHFLFCIEPMTRDESCNVKDSLLDTSWNWIFVINSQVTDHLHYTDFPSGKLLC